MPTAFFVVSVIGFLFTLDAFRPPRSDWVSVPAFFAGWLTSELPLHHLVWQMVATAVFVAAGALHGTAGQIGLAITLVSWGGLIVLAAQASRAGGVLDAALRAGLGDGVRLREGPVPAAGSRVAQWSRLVFAFMMRDPQVEVSRNIAYAEGGRAHKLDVYSNRARPDGAPVLLYFHGGAWIMGDKREQGLPLMLHLASLGWVCVTANYRLSPKAKFPDHLIDCKQAVAWVKDNVGGYGGDPSFLTVSGGSAGGHLASLVALTPNDPTYQPGFEEADTSVSACVSLYGVYDFTDRDGIWGPGFGKHLLERMVMPRPMAVDRRAYELASPMDRITEGAPPFMVIHGSNDSLVPVKEARNFARLLEARSKAPVVYAELPGAQHAFEIFRSIRSAHLVRAVGDFLTVLRGARAEERRS